MVYPDETSMRISGLRGWLWVFVTKTATVYAQRMSRGTDVVEEILGRDFHGALVHDGWAPYDRLARADHQQCFAHLLRRTKEMLEIATCGAVRFPRAVRDLLKDALALRDRRDAGEISPHGLAVARGRLKNRFEGILGWRLTHDGNRKLQRHLRLHADQVFTFLRRDDVEATAWPADHATRPARRRLRAHRPRAARSCSPNPPDRPGATGPLTR